MVRFIPKMDIQVIQMIDVTGMFISKAEADEFPKTDYGQLAFCAYGYHNINGSDEDNSSISQFCKGNDIIKNMIDTKIGMVCYKCYDTIPEEFLKDLTKKQRKRKK